MGYRKDYLFRIYKSYAGISAGLSALRKKINMQKILLEGLLAREEELAGMRNVLAKDYTEYQKIAKIGYYKSHSSRNPKRKS